MRGPVGIAHHAEPRRPELGVDVPARPDAVLAQRSDEPVDAQPVGVVRTLTRTDLVARVVHDEPDVGMRARGGADVHR